MACGLRISQSLATDLASELKRKCQQHPPGVRQQKRKLDLQPPGIAKPFAPKRKKASEMTDADLSREGLEVTGDDASQDFTGQTGWEAHFDNLQQAQFEEDPYGFQPPSY